MSRKGNPWDNAACESFLKTLKYEEVYRTEYRDLAEAQASLGAFLEKVYNQKRLCSGMAKSIHSMRAQSLRTAPSLIDRMSFELAIPRRVALLQSPPPLHQPTRSLQENAFPVQSNSSERRTGV